MNDGVIGFTQAVDGRITGAYFTGDGEILSVHPTIRSAPPSASSPAWAF